MLLKLVSWWFGTNVWMIRRCRAPPPPPPPHSHDQFWLTREMISGSLSIVTALRRVTATESDWMAAEERTSLDSSLSTNTRTPRLLLFHYLLLRIVMLGEFNVVPFIVENEKCHFPPFSLSLSLSANTNLKCLISLCVFNSLIASELKKEA